MVKLSWFKKYTTADLPDTFEMVFQSWDTANKATELNDYSVCTTWGLKEKKLYLLSVLRRRMEYPELKRTIRDHEEEFRDWARGGRGFKSPRTNSAFSTQVATNDYFRLARPSPGIRSQC